MKKKKLSQVEIEAAVDGIRKKYNSLVVEYMRPKKLRDLFEDRYIDALRARIDMGRFIYAEIQAVTKLINDEKEKRIQAEIKYQQKRKAAADGRRNTQSIADRIFNENREKIQKYKSIGLNDPDAYEVNKLYGAMKDFEIICWPVVEKVLKRVYPSRYSGPRLNLETRLFDITITGSDGFPPSLIKLRTMLDRSPREIDMLHREVQRVILNTAFLLHDISDLIPFIRDEGDLSDDERKEVEELSDFVHNVLDDFRLTDLKESRLKEYKNGR